MICHLQAGDAGKPVLQFWPKPENGWHNSQSAFEGKRIPVSQLSSPADREQRLPSSLFLFCSGPQQAGWCPPPLETAICLLSVLTETLTSSWNTLTDTFGSEASLNIHPVIRSSWPMKLTITVVTVFMILFSDFVDENFCFHYMVFDWFSFIIYW